MKFVVDINKTVKKLNNFWNHIHFHPTDAIEDDWGQRILNRVAEDGVAKTVRMYAMLEDIVTMDENGNLQYDFTLNDTRMDYMIEKGFNIFLSYNFIPPCISSDPDELSTVCKNKTRYKGKFIVTAPPKDYKLWEEICRVYTEHIVERYGLSKVKEWRLQCLNEPDLFKFFMYNCEDTVERVTEYNKLYYHFQKGILAVSDELSVGGPALSHDFDFMNLFLKYVRESGCKLDYVCFHTYGTTPWNLNKGEKPLNVRNSVEKIEKIKGIMEDNGFGDKPIVIDEWGIACSGYFNVEECPQLFFRETELYSAYYSRMLTLYDELDLGIEKMMICLSGQHEMVVDFSGFRNFFTLNFFAKPIYNAFKLAGKLGEKKIWCDTKNITEEYSILPTKTCEGTTAVLLSRCTDDLKELETEKVEIKLEGLKGDEKARLWIIDKNNANAYEEFKKLGSPENLTQEQILHIREKAECVYTDTQIIDNTVSFDMQNFSTVLVEIF